MTRYEYWGTSTFCGRKMLEWRYITSDGFETTYYKDAEGFYSMMLQKPVDDSVPTVIAW